MQVFFVMSGMTNSPSNRSFREEVARKSKRLLFPYLFYGLTLLLLGVILPKEVVFERGLLGLLYGRYSFVSPTTGPQTELLRSCVYLAPWWFLPCMFLACMLLWWYDHSRKPALVVLTAIVGGLLPSQLPFLLPWSMDMSCMGFLLMLTGRKLRPVLTTKTVLTRYGMIPAWVVAALLYYVAWKIDHPVNMSVSMMGSLSLPVWIQALMFYALGVSEAVFIALSFLMFLRFVSRRCMAYLGRQALRLLCIHLFIGEAVYYVLAGYEMPMAVRFCCALTVIMVCNYLLQQVWIRLGTRFTWCRYL